MSKWNGKRFSVYTSDEKSALGLIKELGEQTNYNTDELEQVKISDSKKVSHQEMQDIYKIDKEANFTGAWHGIKKPTASQEGLQATVDKIAEEDIPNINSQLEHKAYIGLNVLNQNNSMLIKNSCISNFIEKMLSKQTIKVASLGDSITDCGNVTEGVTGGASSPDKGWFSLLTNYIQNTYSYNVQFTNRGVGGNTVEQAYERVKTQIIPFDYDLIIVELGTNDWNYNTTLEKFESDYKKLIQRLIKTTKASLLCVGLGWFKDWTNPSGNTKKEWQYNQIIKKISLEFNIGYVDTYFEMKNCGYEWEEITLTDDAVHPNDLGHEIWFQAVKQFIDYNGYLIKNDFRKTNFEYCLTTENFESNKNYTIDNNENYYFKNSFYVPNNESGSEIYFRFFGSAIKLFYTKAPTYGKCKIYIDGGINGVDEIDCYNNSFTFNNIREIKNLTLDWHFISIVVEDKHILSSDYNINIEGCLIKNIEKEERLSFMDTIEKSFNTIFYEEPFPLVTCFSNGYGVVNAIDNKKIRIDTNPTGNGGYCIVKGY